MKTNQTPKTVCSVWRDDSNGYGHLTIALYSGASLDRMCPCPFLKLTWQCDHENAGWYALKAETCRDTPADMLIAIKAAEPFLKKIDALPSSNPASLLAALNLPRWVEDRRCSQWMPIDDVKGPEFKRYMSWTEGSCCVSAMATDDDDAKKEIMAKYARNIAERSYGNYAGKLEAWIAAGKPIRQDDWAKCPDTTPTDVLLTPLRAAQPEQVAA